MTSQNQNILTAFNDHFVEFITDVQNVFPENADVLTAKNSLLMIRKANPKMIIKIWKIHIVDKYRSKIENGDISFFLEKDYSSDLSILESSDKIMEGINRLREPIKQMAPENREKTMKYIQNLTKLCILYES
jgi:selenocysteine-specific translation elongation factor